MSNLFSSLRSLLPNEYNRGQSSTSDDIEDATNYIKNLETNIKELEQKRDILKNLSSNNTNNSSIISTNRDVNDNYVTIHRFNTRLEIEISVKVGQRKGFPLSKLVKQVSFVQGLEVVNCFSSNTNERWKCIIHCDMVNDQSNNDLTDLQRKLASEVSSYVA